MNEVNYGEDIALSAEAVWAVIGDFSGIRKTWILRNAWILFKNGLHGSSRKQTVIFIGLKRIPKNITIQKRISEWL